MLIGRNNYNYLLLLVNIRTLRIEELVCRTMYNVSNHLIMNKNKTYSGALDFLGVDRPFLAAPTLAAALAATIALMVWVRGSGSLA